MPVVQSFDGINRVITLDPSVAGASFDPLDLYAEYLAERRDNEQFRGFDSLLRMEGGAPKDDTRKSERQLRLLTDRRGILTKIVLPDTGPYRVRVDGEILTDQPSTDPEPFDISAMTTSVIIDYKPPATQIVTLSTGSGLDAGQDAALTNIESILSNIEGGLNADGLLRIIVAAVAGKGGDDGSGTYRYRDIADTKDRVVAPVTGSERTSVTLDGS